MTYLVNEIFYTIQGEGYWTGRPAVFVRFSRCNLWTGREKDRFTTAICQFCDTDFLHGERLSLRDISDRVDELSGDTMPMIVLTGGEPLLQVDKFMILWLRQRGHYVAVETNGTQPLPAPVDWLCVSPKRGAPLNVISGDELKLVYPQDGFDPSWCLNAAMKFDHYWLSPMDGPHLAENTEAALNYVLDHPRWRLNIQTHKVIGVR